MTETRCIRPMPILEDGPNLRDKIATLSTSTLKAMLDDDAFSHYCDEIHAEMNARGEGHYVAV